MSRLILLTYPIRSMKNKVWAWLLSLISLSALADEIPALSIRPTLEPPVISANTDLKQVYRVPVDKFFVPPPVAEIPATPLGEQIKQGRLIVIDTQTHARQYVGNGLNCSDCHLSEGREPKASPLWAAYVKYPMVKERTNQVVTYQEQIQACFLTAMDGIAPTLESPTMRALTAYSKWLSTGIPMNANMPGRGFAFIKKSKDPRSVHGQNLYKARCAFCHGESGKGQKHTDGKGYMFPPLWGNDSYNRATGFGKTKTLAKFIRANMPLGAPYSLSMDESLDIAAFIWTQYRPYDPKKSMFVNLFIPPSAGQN